MSGWHQATLGDVAAKIDYGHTASAVTEPVGPKFLRITDIQNGAVNWSTVPHCVCSATDETASRLQPGDIVFARTGATTGKSYLIRECPDRTVFASYLIRVRAGEEVDHGYLSHFFQTPQYWAQIAQSARGAAQAGVNASSLGQLRLPLPPLTEQRRIAAILDAADALRQKRRQALRQLDQLSQAIFIEMFGDGSALERRPFGELLSRPLRNGLSPSSAGAVTATVLTLSAVTSGAFKAEAIKEGTFVSTPPADQCVREGEFLICRGNGNRALVGVGVLADRSMPGTAFPDTIIAGGVDQRLLDPDYFAHVWNSTAVRPQIEAAARTTNGTFKVNQAALQRIEVPVPDLTRQARFGDCLRKNRELAGVGRKQLSEMDSLFASLQHRAFRGEL